MNSSNFINIGERTNVTGSSIFKKLIFDENYSEAVKVARQQIDNGAQIIDINMDEGLLDSVKAMTTYLNYLAVEPEISKVPFMIDSSDWNVIEAGLKCVQGKPIVNSISLKEGEKSFLEFADLVKSYGSAVVIMAFDEEGQAETSEKKYNICKRAYELLVRKIDFNPYDIIFDPNIFAVGTGIREHNEYAKSFFDATQMIKKNLPYAKVSGGVSNISFSFRGNNVIREAMHSCFLYHAIKAGLDMAIINAGQISIYDQIPVELKNCIEDVLFNKNDDATENLIKISQNYSKQSTKKKVNKSWRKKSVDERIKFSLINGINDFVVDDTAHLLKKYKKPIKIIEGPLMDGMNVVGDLFGSGQMFLPQVVKSARVMKQSVNYLLPFMEKEKQLKSGKGKILLATVKGDVHDIGKNIVGVVLQCNNFEVIDLGVMVPAERIIETAIKENVNIIGLSGLITPSLDEMCYVASELNKRGIKIPLMIGGATTSKIHTAIKISPNHNFGVIHVTDASKAVSTATKLISFKSSQPFKEIISREYSDIRKNYMKKNKEDTKRTINDSRNNKFCINWKDYKPTKPKKISSSILLRVPVKEIIPYIDWDPFFASWELHGKFPKILDDKLIGKSAKSLWNDTQVMINDIIDKKKIQPQVILGFWPANSIGDDVEIYKDDNRNKVISKFFFLRQQVQRKNSKRANYCLSDFIAPKSTGIRDYLGLFVVTAGRGIEEKANEYEIKKDDYNAILLKSIGDRLAEGLAEKMHEHVRKDLWGYSKKENFTNYDLIRENYTGIRPAPGYPACPDHSEKQTLFQLLGVEKKIKVTLTESFAMSPTSSVAGFYFSKKEASYFGIGKINKDQVSDYADRKKISLEMAEKWLGPNLSYLKK